MMNITQDIKAIDLALYINSIDVLVISDMHMGYEEELNKKGVLIPPLQFKKTVLRLSKILSDKKFSKIIVNGDLKHEFGGISDTEWRNTLKVLDLLLLHCSEVVLVKGNHDTMLEPIALKRNVRVVNELSLGNYYFCHGDVIPKSLLFKKSKNVIMGHEHPAVTLTDGARSENYKCFLVGEYKDKNLFVLPSFNLVTEGTNVVSERLLSPFLQQDLGNFRAFIVSDKVYDFGKIKSIGK